MNQFLKNNSLAGFQKLHSSPPYFEGYYTKLINKEGKMIVLIAGIIFSEEENYAFIQLASNQLTEVHFYKFPLEQFETSKNEFSFSIGENRFSEKGVTLSLPELTGKIELTNVIRWKRNWWNPGIMGLLTFVPGVECKHDIIIPSAKTKGELLLDSKKIQFDDGDVYIEKNWGRSFPKTYIWLHANQFQIKNLSVQFALAKPKWLFWRPSVYIGYLKYQNKTIHYGSHRFSSAKLIRKNNKEEFIIILNRLSSRLTINIKQEAPQNLKAPKNGEFQYDVKEYMNSEVSLRLEKKSFFRKNKEIIFESSKLATSEFN